MDSMGKGVNCPSILLQLLNGALDLGVTRFEAGALLLGAVHNSRKSTKTVDRHSTLIAQAADREADRKDPSRHAR